jgi:hypothetical protein
MKYLSQLLKGFSSIFLCGLLMGCPGPLNVPSSWVDSFTRNGATESEVRAALLECGSSVPGSSLEYRTREGKGFPPAFEAFERIWVGRCMKNSGFPYNDDRTCAGGIDMNGKLIIPAPCKPDAVIPKRSVENRLNSPYCKTYPKTKICQPDYYPSRDDLSQPINPHPSPKSIAISIAPSTDPAIKLQNQVQKDSNAQMNQLLQGVGGRK